MPPIEQLAAEQFASQQPAEMVSFFQPVIEVIKPAVGTLSAVVGGLFGLYFIFIVVRLYYERRKLKLLKNINYDLDYLNQHFNLPYSHERKIPRKIMPLDDLRKKIIEREKKQKEKLAKKVMKKKRKKKQ